MLYLVDLCEETSVELDSCLPGRMYKDKFIIYARDGFEAINIAKKKYTFYQIDEIKPSYNFTNNP